MKSACFVMLLAVPLAAQTIQGDVYDSVTGAPLSGAYVSYPFPNSANPVMARTDVSGHFTMTVSARSPLMGAGLQVVRTGYLQNHAGIPVKPSEDVTNIRISLTPEAVISGKLVDEDGFPVSNGQIIAQQYRPGEEGPPKLSMVGSANLNDLGEYRIFRLATGTYCLTVSYGAINWDRRYLPQFIGGGLEPNEKNGIEVKAGEHRTVDGHLAKYDGVTVSGRVLTPAGASLKTLILSMRSKRPGAYFDAPGTQPDESFLFRHVPPGSYTVHVESRNTNGQPQPGDWLGETPLEVGTSDIVGVTITPHVVKPVDIAGIIVQASGNPMLVSITARGNNNEGASATSADDGSFVLKGLLPGHYNLQVQPDYTRASMMKDGKPNYAAFALPSSALLDGQEVLHDGFELSGPPAGPLRIAMKPIIAITGKVVDAAGNPVPGAMLQLINDKGFPDGAGSTDKDGAIQAMVRNAGTYRIYAGDPASLMDPDYLKAHEKDFPLVRIVQGENPPVLIRLPAK